MNDDPFSFDEDDRTVMQPSGGRAAPPPAVGVASSAGLLPPMGGINPLEKAASRLLPLLISMKNTSSHPDPQRLRNQLIRELDDFKRQALEVLGDSKKVVQASYVMCSVLDEAAMNTPWGHQANWAQHNLLSTFHNEVAGGERFFQLLKTLGKDPAANIELLELMYVCLSLGYEGAYRVASNGQQTLVRVRQWLYDIIRFERGERATELSSQWEGADIQQSRLPRFTVFWVAGAVLLGASSLAYGVLRVSLGSTTEQTVSQFLNARVAPLAVRTILPPVKPKITQRQEATSANVADVVTLTTLLAPEIDARQVQVLESFDKGTVRIIDTNLFASGRATINPDTRPLLSAIGEAMQQLPGSIVVTGHSDNIPIRSGRFASNLELSRARAQSVADLLGQTLGDVGRLRADGRGSNEPIADNSTPAGRSANRRVEVTLFY